MPTLYTTADLSRKLKIASETVLKMAKTSGVEPVRVVKTPSRVYMSWNRNAYLKLRDELQAREAPKPEPVVEPVPEPAAEPAAPTVLRLGPPDNTPLAEQVEGLRQQVWGMEQDLKQIWLLMQEINATVQRSAKDTKTLMQGASTSTARMANDVKALKEMWQPPTTNPQ